MPLKLPLNIADLLRQRTVEGARIEYKAGWNPDATLRTLCAFANDFENLGGGYVVIGQDRTIRDALGYMQRSHLFETVIKHPDRAEATRFWNFPYAAIEEALVNAVYHRSFEEREPIEVRISRDELVVLSFLGPDRSIRLADFEAGRAVSRRYRNRRIGEFLKELDLTEGRSTGVPKILKGMAANGSPVPLFESDDERIAYTIRLPVHPLAQPPDTVATGEVTMQVTMQVEALLQVLEGEMSRRDIQALLGLKNADYFRKIYLVPAIAAGCVEMTLPGQPQSSKQRYRLTPLGQHTRRTLGNQP